ncbi:FMN-binding protein [Dactylosporangium sp. CA-052675]|uniref:FMN-binding protein n=1 Tax=Dactylosporangium sp. CA-052675 TaxID=3239927 RepID=UPI003D8F3726
MTGDSSMRRIVLWLASTAVALVLLFSYRPSSGGALAGVATPAGSGNPAGAGTAAGAGKTYDGSTASTRWGPVRVRITVQGGRITDVEAVTYPTANRRDQQINAYALPRLRAEALQAQSADIDSVSGATVTSEGYKTSLQAALDAAGIG